MLLQGVSIPLKCNIVGSFAVLTKLPVKGSAHGPEASPDISYSLICLGV